MMNMTFHFSDNISHLLFYAWEIKTVEDMILAVSVIFLAAVVLELLKLFLLKLGQRRNRHPLYTLQESRQGRSNPINTPHGQDRQQNAPLLASLRIPSSVSKMRARRFKYHAIEAFLHTTQVTLGYMLMLVVMTYNAYFLITIVLALTVSFFFLAPLRSMKDPLRVPARHHSLTDSDQRSAPIFETAERGGNPNYGSLYQ